MSTDLYALMIQYLGKAEAGGVSDGQYDSQDQSIYYMVAMLIAKILSISNEVVGIGNESNDLNTLRQDVINVNKDISQMQQWAQDHSKDSPQPPLPATLVQQFMKDMLQYQTDLASAKEDADKWGDNGFSNQVAEAQGNFDMMWKEDAGSGKNVGDLIKNGDETDLGKWLTVASYYGTSTSGVFYDWTTKGEDGYFGLSQVNTDLGTDIQNYDTELNTDGTYLQQDDQVAQNGINGFGSMINQFVTNQKSQ